jgi:phosphatidylglycerophosphate synthase
MPVSVPTPQGRKLPPELENPFDNWFIEQIALVHPYFYAAGFTANGITILSGVLQFAAIAFMHAEAYVTAAAVFLLGYFFDCMDGWYARYYKMTSKFGDKLDHYKDLLVAVALVGYVAWSPRIPLNWKFVILLATVFMLCMNVVYVSCQEAYYGKAEEGESLGFTKGICTPEEAPAYLSKYRWFGLGTSNVLVALTMVSFHFIA